jgi:hypothetical protein
MSNNKDRKQSYRAVLASVKVEMAEPRVAESAHVEIEKEREAKVKEGAKA